MTVRELIGTAFLHSKVLTRHLRPPQNLALSYFLIVALFVAEVRISRVSRTKFLRGKINLKK